MIKHVEIQRLTPIDRFELRPEFDAAINLHGGPGRGKTTILECLSALLAFRKSVSRARTDVDIADLFGRGGSLAVVLDHPTFGEVAIVHESKSFAVELGGRRYTGLASKRAGDWQHWAEKLFPPREYLLASVLQQQLRIGAFDRLVRADRQRVWQTIVPSIDFGDSLKLARQRSAEADRRRDQLAGAAEALAGVSVAELEEQIRAGEATLERLRGESEMSGERLAALDAEAEDLSSLLTLIGRWQAQGDALAAIDEVRIDEVATRAELDDDRRHAVAELEAACADCDRESAIASRVAELENVIRVADARADARAELDATLPCAAAIRPRCPVLDRADHASAADEARFGLDELRFEAQLVEGASKRRAAARSRLDELDRRISNLDAAAVREAERAKGFEALERLEAAIFSRTCDPDVAACKVRIEAALADARRRRGELAQQHAVTVQTLDVKSGEVGRLRGRHDAVAEAIDPAVLEAAETDAAEWRVVVEGLSPRGIAHMLGEDLVPRIAGAANALLEGTGTGFSIWPETMADKSDGGMRPVLEVMLRGAGGDRPLEACSPGELSIVEEAFRLALTREIGWALALRDETPAHLPASMHSGWVDLVRSAGQVWVATPDPLRVEGVTYVEV